MVIPSIIRRFAALIACWAILFAALAPSMSQAMAASSGNAWTEICSAAGIKQVLVAGGQGDPVDAPASSGHLEHCSFCATHLSAVDVLPGSCWSIPLLKGRATHPSLFFQSSAPLAIWTLAQSRAPPV